MRSLVPRYYLGIDGGQSSTIALVADETGRILGAGRSGPCNHVSTSEARSKFVAVIGECLDRACSAAGIDMRQTRFAAACLGFSGGAEDKEQYAREAVHSDRYKITNDAEIALAGATGGEPGIIIIAGTGSIAFGRNQAGRTARAGGWGYVFGDEGGAFDIARRALRAALQFEEGWGSATSLRTLLLDATQTRSANQLLHRFYGDYPRSSIAALASWVTQAAEDDDEVAAAILESSANALVWYVEGVYRNLFSPGESMMIVHVGGVFQSSPLRTFFADRLRLAIGCEPSFPRFSPVVGAVLEALRIDGLSPELSGVPETVK